MPSMLSVNEPRSSRSKSPGGRERDRSNSRDTRAKSPPRTETRKPRSKYSESESESEEDDRRRDRRSSKKYYDDPPAEDDRRRKSSKKHSSEEEDTRHTSSRSLKKYYDDEPDDKRSKRDAIPSRRRDESEEDDRREQKSKKSSRRKDESEDGSSGSEDIHRMSKSDYKEKKDGRENGRPAQYPPVSAPYAPASSQYGYPSQPTGYIAEPRVDPRSGYHNTRHASYVDNSDPRYAPSSNAYPQGHSDVPDHHRTHSISTPSGRYADPERFQYAQPDANLAYKARDPGPKYAKAYDKDSREELVEIKPQKNDRYEKRPEKKYVDDKYDRRDKKYNDDRYGSPPDDMTKKMTKLAVGGGLGAGLGAGLVAAGRRSSDAGGKPPASPLLEAYKGTYQSMSPMPGALVLANHKHDSDISDLDMSDSDSSQSGKDELKKKIKKLEKEKHRHEKERAKEDRDLIEVRRGGRDRKESDLSVTTISPSTTRKKVSFYDPTPDAKKIAVALQGTHSAPNVKPLMQILPDLSSDDLFALRAEYKNYAKIAGQGINMSKHIKTRVPGNLGKVVYATALGRWESEAYWANSWYQGGASRRELLIESLMGRSNSDIHEIKNCFKDKRYNDDLEKCMKAELKADKFRVAILLALEERRMADGVGLEIDTIQRDASDLYRALVGKEGGETAMIQIIVVRSDAHLREVLRVFERKYEMNFAREMISKSRNLVGETLAHILNGALNRAMRDALLLHQAISETAPGKERAELLISRVVRLHWEPKHLERVKMEYEKRYKIPVDVAIKREVVDLMKTEEGRLWAEFCIELVRSSGR